MASLRLAALAPFAFVAALFTVGCGSWEEAEYPQAYRVPEPPSSAELAAQQQARSETREVLLGAETDADERAEYDDTDPSALTEFKPALEGHGTWVDDGTYGTVWVPSSNEVGTDFEPYVSAGHWTYSDDTDYVWVSDYSWGWAPFHYGRWVHLPGHGWSWIPGRRYAGAWVTWRTGAGYGYVGWAPAPPSWYWSGGVAYGWSHRWYDHRDHYVYCPRERVYGGSSYVVRGPDARIHDGRTQDYVPASPSVGGPGRVTARPSVNGGPASGGNLPTVAGGRVAARPAVRGPRPSELGNDGVIVAPPAGDRGLAQARAVATPRVVRPTVHDPVARAPQVVDPSRGPATNALVPGGSSLRGTPSRVASPSVGQRIPTPYEPPRASFGGDRTPASPRVSSSPRVASPSEGAPRVASPSVGYSPPRVASPSVGYSPPRVASPSPRIASPSVSYNPPRVASPSPRIASPSPSPSVASPRVGSSLVRPSSPMRSASPSVSPMRSSPSVRTTASPRVRKR